MTLNYKGPAAWQPGLFNRLPEPAGRLFFQKTEFFVEAANPATAVNQVLVATGPGGMGGRIDIQLKVFTLLAPGRTGLER